MINTKIIISGILMLLVDAIYLKTISPHFNKMFIKIQGSGISINWLGFTLSYISLIAGLYYFILRQNKSPYEAFILGVFVYSVYDMVNFATFKKWDFKLALIDSIWGGILFSLITYLTYNISKHI